MAEILVNMRYDGPERTIAERAYRLLREDIISGALAPGLKLKIEMLRARYGLGAAPIREALARLSSDHLVKLEGQRGCEVVPMSVKDARDIGEMRKLLEIEALRVSIASGGEEWESTLAAAFHRLERLERTIDQGIDDLAEWETLNHQFHKALVAACDSEWLLRMRQLMFDQHERYRRLSRVKTVATRDISLEHRALFEAALDRDASKAVSVMETHIGRTTGAVVQTFARHQSELSKQTS